MDLKGGVSGAGGDKDLGSKGSQGPKGNRSDFEATMKAMKDAVLKENAEKLAQIRRLVGLGYKVMLEETSPRLENASLEEPDRPIPCPNPFIVFPAVVWESIIDKVKRSSDLGSLLRAFPQLEPFVKKIKRTTLLFENVLPLVGKQLDFNDIIKCRLACGKWNQDVCALLANWNSPNLLPGPSQARIPNFQPPDALRNPYLFGHDAHVKNFLGYIRTLRHPGNPFLGRYMYLFVGYFADLKLYWKSIAQLLKNFGEHVWNFQIEFSRSFMNQVHFLQALQEILTYLPNLRYLTVHYSPIIGEGPSETDLAAQIRICPLPPLRYLQSFKLMLNGVTGAMFSAFHNYFSSQIHQLELIGEALTLMNVNFEDEYLRGLINVEYLQVELIFRSDVLRLLEFPCRNLKKLCLTSDLPRSELSVTLEDLGSLLEKFSRLEHLNLSKYRVDFSMGARMRRLPRLTTLKTAIDANEDDRQHTLDFLLWIPYLKHLIIDNIHPGDVDVVEMDKHSILKIRKFLFTKQLLSSNIWTRIPSLELLEVETGSRNEKWTREMYEDRIG